MKRMVTFVLALLICFSLCACGAETQENVTGAYYYVSGIDYTKNDATIILNDDFTYDRGYEKGTYKVDRNKIFLHCDNNSNSTTTLVKQGDVYYVEASFEPMKDDYGRTVAFSEEGRINYTFQWHTIGEKDPKYTDIILREDGSFTAEERIIRNNDIFNMSTNTQEGTYSFENSILTLNGKNFTRYWVCTEDGFTTEVYKKYTPDQIKGKLLGKWNNVWEVEELPSYEFLEDGTLIRYHASGDTTYTYEIMEDGLVKCEGSAGSETIQVGYSFNNGCFVMSISEPWFMEPWVQFVKE